MDKITPKQFHKFVKEATKNIRKRENEGVSYEDVFGWKGEMQWVFVRAIEKAEKRLDGKKYVERPWDEAPLDWLQDRFQEELIEMAEAETCDEIADEWLDILNFAAFIYLKLTRLTFDEKEELGI